MLLPGLPPVYAVYKYMVGVLWVVDADLFECVAMVTIISKPTAMLILIPVLVPIVAKNKQSGKQHIKKDRDLYY